MRPIFALALLTACQTAPNPVEPKKAPTGVQAPIEYTAQFKALPLVASLSRLPWPSESWASAYGGASFRWQMALVNDADELEDMAPYIRYPLGQKIEANKLAPSEKLDLYLGNKDWALTKKERHRTLEQTNADGSPRKDLPEWEGIMHAWSIAALQFEPVAPVTLATKGGQAVTFDVQDIYSLLSLYVHEQAPRPTVLASLCPEYPASKELGASAGEYAFENRKQALRRMACGPIDAAQFHLVLANQIGKLNEGFVIDRDNDGVIANNPVVAYESRIIEAPNTLTKAWTAGEPRTLHMRTIVFLTAETPVVHLDEEDLAYPYDSETYDYELDVNAEGDIVKGRWLTSRDANATLPDFMWKANPVWLNGPIKTIYDQARQGYVSKQSNRSRQLRPLEDMPQDERESLNSYFSSPASTQTK